MKKDVFKKAARPVLAVAAAVALAGYTINSTNTITWEYFGTPTAGNTYTYNPTNGLPTIAEFTSTIPADSQIPALPSDILTKVDYTLPEGVDIRQNTQGLLPDSDDKTNLRFQEEAEVWVTFIKEGAGYQNSVGFFQFDQANMPTSASQVQEKIFFANASAPGPLSNATTTGNTVYLGKFAAGKGLGMALIANGFSSSGRTLAGGGTMGGVKENVSRDWIFYTLRNLNPEGSSAANLNVHTVMLKDLADSQPGYQRLVIGMEDINRVVGGDHDFNDVVMAIHVKPRTAIKNLDDLGTLVKPTDPDTDGDGVKDSLDEFPNDPNRAFTRAYPDRNGWGTLAYEDEWPKRGDYDMNDMVVRYRTLETLDAQRRVVDLQIDYKLDARGATFDNGFAVHLPGVASNAIASATLSRMGASAMTITPESGVSDAVFHIFNSSNSITPDNGCYFFNTKNECGKQVGRPFQLKVTFAYPHSTFPTAPYNPFIYRTADRGIETHLPGKPPTSKANVALFGSQDDKTNTSTGYTYMDANRLPWAIDVPYEWAYPKENSDIAATFSLLSTWASSGGNSAKNWYVNGVTTRLFTGN